jgi:hypothetical protein
MPDPYGWGLAEEGLQLGLFHAGDRREFSYGDTVELVIRARNVGAEPLSLCYAPTRYVLVSALPGNRLRLETASGRESQYLRLDPGEEKVVPGLEARLRLEPPGDGDWEPAADRRDDVMRLLPGEYDVEVPYPIWLADPTDPDAHTAHRAHPGMARFTVRDDPANPWIVERVVYDASGIPSLLREMPADPGAVVTQMERPPDSLLPADAEANGQPVAWGGFVNGLQAGIRLEDTPDPPTPDAPKKPRGGLTFGYYVRNCTNRPLLVTMADLGGSTWNYSDWSPYILDSEGNHVPNPGVVDTGWREQLKHPLAPGQCLRIASLRLRLVDAEKATTIEGPPAPDDRGSVPEAKVRPGRYTVSCTEGAQWAAGGRVDMVLMTGRVAFEVTAEDLGRE